jgi:hypothetical protein
MINRNIKAEEWALKIIETVKTAKRKVEDFRVELKSEWIYPPEKAARRIAAHANSAFGSDILWIIGLDEDKGVLGIQEQETDLADWWHQVQAQFDGLSPNLLDFNIYIDGLVIKCLLFDTSRPPYGHLEK